MNNFKLKLNILDNDTNMFKNNTNTNTKNKNEIVLDDKILNCKYNDYYYINLEKDTDRRKTFEINYNYLNSARISAIQHSKGFIGLLYTNYNLLKNLYDNNLLNRCPIIFEDDCLILNNNNFIDRWGQYKKYLIENCGKWNYFSGGSIYLKPIKIINKNPCIVECSYGLCTQLIVHSNKSAKTVLDYVDNDKMTIGIDRVLCYKLKTFWVPYPFLCIQKSKNTNICTRMKPNTYLEIIQKEFVKSQNILRDFVNKNINKSI
jgi:hypothetical protein